MEPSDWYFRHDNAFHTLGYRHPIVKFKQPKPNDDFTYEVVYSEKKLEAIHLTVGTANGGHFEFTSHELAHIVQLVLRNIIRRLFMNDYGYAFSPISSINIAEKAYNNEIEVLAIQAHIMEMANADPIIDKDFNQMLDGIVHLDAFKEVHLSEQSELNLIKQYYKKYTKEQIRNAIERWIALVDAESKKTH